MSETNGIAVQAERFVVAYLLPLLTNVGVEFLEKDPLPFYKVTRVTGHDDMISDYPVISINTFATDRKTAGDNSMIAHGYMKALTPKVGVVVDGITYGVDFLRCTETPRWVDYDDKTIRRYVGRYKLGLRLS